MSKFCVYDIWYASFLHEDESVCDDRPVLIINVDGKLRVLVLKITTNVYRKDKYDMEILHWHEAGLQYPSVVRTRNRLWLEEADFRKKIGALHQDDVLRLQLKMTE